MNNCFDLEGFVQDILDPVNKPLYYMRLVLSWLWLAVIIAASIAGAAMLLYGLSLKLL